MSDILQIFSPNPLSTTVGKLIDQATNPSLDAEDWNLNFPICDLIDSSDDEAKNAVKAIKKRLQQIESQDKEQFAKAFYLILSLVETCIDNCNERFHSLLLTKDFVQELVRLIGPKNNPPIELQDRVLSLIETWATADSNHMQAVGQVYKELKAKGVMFPTRDQTKEPSRSSRIYRLNSASQLRQQQQTGGVSHQDQEGSSSPSPKVIEGELYNKICRDLETVQTSVTVFKNILDQFDTNESEANSEENWLLMETLDVSCKQMKERIVDLITKVANEDLTVELLRLNDELNFVFERFKDLLIRKASLPDSEHQVSSTSSSQQLAGSSKSPTITTVAIKPADVDQKLEDSLIDFTNTNEVIETNPQIKQKSDDIEGSLPQKTSINNLSLQDNVQASLSNKFNALSVGDDNITVRTKSGDGYQKEDGHKQLPLPEHLSTSREQDFVEIENWLDNNNSGKEANSNQGSNFDAFIESRARVGETLQQVTTSGGDKTSDGSKN